MHRPMWHGPHDQHGEHDPEGRPINYVEGDVCVVISAQQIEDATSPPGPARYEEVRNWLNHALSILVRSDPSLDSLIACDPDPNGTDDQPAEWLVPKQSILNEDDKRGRPLLPWIVLPRIPNVDDASRPSEAAFFYQVGVAEPANVDSHDRRILIVQRLVDLINARLAQSPSTGDFTILGAHPNWFQDSSDGHSTGCPGSRPEVAPNYYWKFTFPRHTEIENALTASGPTANVVVAILDTCPEPSVVRAAASLNPLLQQIVSSGVGIGEYPLSLTESQATYFHPGSSPPVPATPPWHLPAPAPAGTTWDNFEIPDHGLMVAGIVRDIAPQAEIHLVRVLGEYGVGHLQGVTDVLKQLPVALHIGSKKLVVNLSLVSSVPPTWPHGIKLNLALELVINWLTRQGFLVVASAGNQGHDSLMPRPDPMYPARFSDVFSVTTVTRQRHPTWLSCKATQSAILNNGIATFGGDVLPPFASTPAMHDPFIDVGASPVEAVVGVYSKPGRLPLDGITGYSNPTLAPGVVRDNLHGWVYWSGASFATAIISGVAARLWRMNSSLGGVTPPPSSPPGTATMRQKIQGLAEANRLAYAPTSPERIALDGVEAELLCEVIEAAQC